MMLDGREEEDRTIFLEDLYAEQGHEEEAMSLLQKDMERRGIWKEPDQDG
jgi:hypothetical protein